jgi:hypothetical protein
MELGLTWTKRPLGIRDQNEVLRRLEYALPLFDFLVERLLRRLLSPMSRAVLEAPMISPPADLIGETESETSTALPSLCRRKVS